MTPRVEIPVVAVVHQALRRDFAVGDIAAYASVVFDFEPLALHQRIGDGNETRPGSASGHAQNAHPAREFATAQMLGPENFVDLVPRRLQRFIEQSRFSVGQQFLRGQQCVEFGGIEPDTRQFVRAARRVAIAVFVTQIFDWRAVSSAGLR